MSRSALPQDYNKIAGTLWQDFETTSGWSCYAGTMANNTSQYHTGTQSLRFGRTGGDPIGVRKTGLTMDFGSINKTIEIWFYPHVNPYTNISSINIYLCTNGASNAYQAQLDGSEFRQDMWNRTLIPRSVWTKNGAGDWNNITWLDIKVSAETGMDLDLSIDSMYYGLEQDGRLMISFDDAYTSVYTEAFAYMQPRGIKGIIYTIPVKIDTPGYMTSAQLTELYAAGWDIANHTYNHSAYDGGFLTDLSQSEIELELTLCQAWLEARGYTRASRHVAYPGGSYNDTVFAAMTAAGMLTGRITTNNDLSLPIGDFRYLRSQHLYYDTTLATAKAKVDRVVDWGCTDHLFTHTLVESPTGNNWSTANFQALIDYIVERRAKVVTMSEWYEGLTNPRYTSTPPSRAAR